MGNRRWESGWRGRKVRGALTLWAGPVDVTIWCNEGTPTRWRMVHNLPDPKREGAVRLRAKNARDAKREAERRIRLVVQSIARAFE